MKYVWQRDSNSNTIQGTYTAIRRWVQHTYDTIDQTMGGPHSKERPLTWHIRRLHIYSLTLQTQKMNDNFTDTNDPIFDIIRKTYPSKQYWSRLSPPSTQSPFPTTYPFTPRCLKAIPQYTVVTYHSPYKLHQEQPTNSKFNPYKSNHSI
jgi:hypothetical protein